MMSAATLSTSPKLLPTTSFQEHQPIQRRENAIAADPALLQDGMGKSLSQEPRSARDQDLHLFRYALQSLWVNAVE